MWLAMFLRNILPPSSLLQMSSMYTVIQIQAANRNENNRKHPEKGNFQTRPYKEHFKKGSWPPSPCPWSLQQPLLEVAHFRNLYVLSIPLVTLLK
jgi:hypothetical protein